ERGEAIHLASQRKNGLLRCARNDEGTSYPRRRVSSTLRPIDSITAVSGILDHPLSQMMTTEYAPLFSRRTAPEVCSNFPPPKSEGAGNAGCTLHPRSRVQYVHRNAHTSIQVQS